MFLAIKVSPTFDILIEYIVFMSVTYGVDSGEGSDKEEFRFDRLLMVVYPTDGYEPFAAHSSSSPIKARIEALDLTLSFFSENFDN